ncbi:hypothetical protein GCM10027290_59950 [Micromonospora sonneratiae]
MTRFLVVLTDVRPLTVDGRNERLTPERRRQVVGATSREAADKIAGAFMALGMVRAGRQRVKVIAVGRKQLIPATTVTTSTTGTTVPTEPAGTTGKPTTTKPSTSARTKQTRATVGIGARTVTGALPTTWTTLTGRS